MSEKRKSRDPRRDSEGFSLLVVLLTIMAIAVILMPLTIRAKTQAVFDASLLRTDQLDFLAEGIATVLAARVMDRMNARGQALAMNSMPYRCSLGSLHIDYRLQDQSGLINVNLAPKPLLEAGFRSLGFSTDDAEITTNAVIAFRTPKRRSTTGVRGLEIIGGLKHTAMETVSELYDIRTIRRVPFQQLSATFTVHTQSPRMTRQYVPHALEGAIADEGQFIQASAPRSQTPFVVSVKVHDAVRAGQFNSVFVASVNAKPRILETWRYDIETEGAIQAIEEDCSVRFGSDFADAVLRMS